jgi:thiol-disulfide isomerase/thioredoxin
MRGGGEKMGRSCKRTWALHIDVTVDSVPCRISEVSPRKVKVKIMKMRMLLSLAGVAAIATNACAAEQSPSSLASLRESGAFEFPQKQATVLCDRPDLRFSVWNNQEYLFAQAVVWNDDDSSLGKSEENREIGDWSQVMLDLDADGKATAKIDRDYMLNPWPHLGGLHYQICVGERAWSGIYSDSKGRGAIRYVEVSTKKLVRVDTYLIPMAEIAKEVGDKIRLCYWGFSPTPALTINSTGYERIWKGWKRYYGYNVPLAQYHDYVLGKGGEIDAAKVPEGRDDISLSHRKNVTMPEVGQAAPEISAKDWMNLKAPLTLASLRGKVVLLEFWATWCGPCVQGIPHLNELERSNVGKGFQLLTLVEEGHQTMDKFIKRTPVEYPIGLESTALEDYGISAIPHAFVLNQAGKIVWHGHPAEPEMEKAISNALNEAK